MTGSLSVVQSMIEGGNGGEFIETLGRGGEVMRRVTTVTRPSAGVVQSGPTEVSRGSKRKKED